MPLFSSTSQFVTFSTVPNVFPSWLPHFQCGPRFTRLPIVTMPTQRPSPLVHGGAWRSRCKQHVQQVPLYAPGCVIVSPASVIFSSSSSSFTYFVRSACFASASSSVRLLSSSSSAFCRLPYIRISFLHRSGGYPNFSNPFASVIRMRLIELSFS